MQFLITFGLVINTSLAFTSTVDSGYPYIMVSFVPTKSSHIFSKLNPFKTDTS